MSATGLTSAEVEARRLDGRSNDVPDPTSRTIAQIIRANVFTPFNALLGVLLVVILAIREPADGLFGIVLVANALIGIVQEVRAKRSLDRLAVLNAPRSTVRRDGAEQQIASKDLVLDDIVVLSLGDQIAVDATVLEASGLEVDESLLTGEADPVAKTDGDPVLSGSFVVAGSAEVRATAVGENSYAFRLSSEARRFSLVRSELRTGIDRVIKLVSWLMVPTAVLLVSSQLAAHDGLVGAIQASVAGLVAMVPEGLVLLTSIAFAVGATRLAGRRVLTQELAAIEGLARVDVICLDKTGTLTEGSLTLGLIEHLEPMASTAPAVDVAAVLGALGAADPHPNPSLAAIVAAHGPPAGWDRTDTVPFSSARKWSAAAFADHGAFVLGAPDILLDCAAPAEAVTAARHRVDHYASAGRRVLILTASPAGLTGETLPAGLVPLAVIVLDEALRPAAPDTIAYFGRQGVTVKVISGDSPVTVGAVATRVGVPGAEDPIDARTLPTDQEALAEVLDTHSVFGRVTPQQKRAMVHALQSRGHVVAMTGDGVNDTLALKDADVGVAMGSGSSAARAVARFVLLANDFGVFPSVITEGRKVIANVERVANLFLTKTFYALMLALAIGVARIPFPFIPRHFTIISSLTIGIPGFFLALAPNDRRARSGFLTRVLRFAIPSGLIAAVAVLVAFGIARNETGVTLDEARTVAVMTLFVVTVWVLSILSRPLELWRIALVGAMVVGFIGALSFEVFRTYFALPLPGAALTLAAIGIGAIGAALIELGWRLAGWHLPGLDPTDRADPEDANPKDADRRSGRIVTEAPAP
ncbi:MAG: cation-translocating P-type ATPase [Acidobacteria bacterium]|nr:cation-translocating P-type ATPase [Acidobacteriota bacterium]